MQAFVGLLLSLAVVAVAGAGVAATVGLHSVRDRLAGVAVVLVVVSLAVPAISAVMGSMLPAFSSKAAVGGATARNGQTGVGTAGTLALFALGHAALAVFLVRRRLQGSERHRRDADEVERARGRGRPRLSPDGEEQGQ